MIRHHRLLELFLAKTLEMSLDRVHAEAEVLEHVLSEELEELIAAKLGDPRLDPHGDPIPSADLELAEPETHSLDASTWATGVSSYACPTPTPRECGISRSGASRRRSPRGPERQPFGGPLLVSFAGREHALGGLLAAASASS